MRGQANGVEDRRPRGDDHQADDDEEDEEEEEGRHRGQGPPPQRRHQAQRPSSGPQQLQQQPRPPPPLTRNAGYVGKHRLSAAIARLDQELQSLQVPARLAPLPALLSLTFARSTATAAGRPARETPSSSVESTSWPPTCCRSYATCCRSCARSRSCLLYSTNLTILSIQSSAPTVPCASYIPARLVMRFASM